MKRFTKLHMVTFFALLVVMAARAQRAHSDTLRVGIFANPPFVIAEGEGGYSGLSIDLWERMAAKMNVHYTYVRYSDPVGIVRSLDYGDLDIGINPYAISPLRMKKFKVSQPFHESSIGVAITTSTQSQFQVFVQNFFSKDFLNVVVLLLLILFSFGTILWFVERRANKYQFRPGILGLFDGLWWAAVTMTTVGYGDKAPKTNAGKTIAIIWMFTAVIIISSFTATIASTLTVNSLEGQVNGLEDLKGIERVGVVGASSGVDFLQAHAIQPFKVFTTTEMALLALSNKEIQVLVDDRTALQYQIRNRQMEDNVTLLSLTFNSQYRSFIMPNAHPLFDEVNQILVEEIQSADFRDMKVLYNLDSE